MTSKDKVVESVNNFAFPSITPLVAASREDVAMSDDEGFIVEFIVGVRGVKRKGMREMIVMSVSDRCEVT